MIKKNRYTTIYLIRHGEVYNPDQVVYGRLPGFGLSKNGFDQARAAAQYLKNKNLGAIYSSPLLRTKQTANEIANLYPNHKLHILTSCIEVDHCIEGFSLEKLIKNKTSLYSGKHKARETPENIATRMTKTINRLVDKHQGHSVAIISHGDPIFFCVLSLLSYELTSKIIKKIDSLERRPLTGPIPYPDKASIFQLKFNTNRNVIKFEYIKPYP